MPGPGGNAPDHTPQPHCCTMRFLNSVVCLDRLSWLLMGAGLSLIVFVAFQKVQPLLQSVTVRENQPLGAQVRFGSVTFALWRSRGKAM